LVAFYISGHGFGHASRQIEIINAVATRLDGHARIVIRTAAARWLFDRTLRTPVTFLPGDADTGVVQIDSLRLDEAATVHAAREFYSTFHHRVEAEAALLRAHDVRLVIADAPPLACAAAAAAGIPSIVISNFTWDWIYEGYAEQFDADAPEVLPIIREAYAQATEGWRLPMGGGFAAFRSVADLPFVARHATKSRDEVLGALDLPSSRPLVLSSFGGYRLEDLSLHSLDCLDRWTVAITGRTRPSSLPEHVAFVDERHLYERGMRYEDLVAAVDVVATKPGYGIISECIANDTAILYTSRGRFPEYDVMVREMPRYLRCVYIDQDALLAGRWLASLDRLFASPPPPERPATDGADVAAERIAAIIRT
jgi:L-arabinokinase